MYSKPKVPRSGRGLRNPLFLWQEGNFWRKGWRHQAFKARATEKGRVLERKRETREVPSVNTSTGWTSALLWLKETVSLHICLPGDLIVWLRMHYLHCSGLGVGWAGWGCYGEGSTGPGRPERPEAPGTRGHPNNHSDFSETWLGPRDNTIFPSQIMLQGDGGYFIPGPPLIQVMPSNKFRERCPKY